MSNPDKPGASECKSFKTDIRPKFTDEDVKHMKEDLGMDLADYETVKDEASLILRRLKDANRPMPPAPRGPWPPEWIVCFEQWIKNGRQE